MNKYLYQNWKIFNQVAIKTTDVDFEDSSEAAAEKLWTHLVNDNVERIAHYKIKGKQGRTISVLTDDNYVYIFQVIRTEYNTNKTTIIVGHKTETNINDFKSMAKFIHYNIKEIIGHSKKAAQELNKLVTAQNIEKEIADGNA